MATNQYYLRVLTLLAWHLKARTMKVRGKAPSQGTWAYLRASLVIDYLMAVSVETRIMKVDGQGTVQ